MRDVLTLTLLELRGLYGINKYRYTRDAQEKKRARLLCAAWIAVIAVVAVYVGALVLDCA